MSLLSSKTSLKSLKYSDFIQSKKVESATDLRAFKNTGASIELHKSPDTKTGLGLEFEKRKEDVVRLGKATVTGPQAIRFQTNQALLNQSVAINEVLRGNKPDLKQVAIGAARVAGVTASALAQAAAEGTGLRVIQGFTPLNGGYLTQGNLAGAAFASLNPFGTGDNQISKGTVALRGRTINDGFIKSSQPEAKDITGFRTSQVPTTGNFDATYLSSVITKTTLSNKVDDTTVSTKLDSAPYPISREQKKATKNLPFSEFDELQPPEKFINGDTGVPFRDTLGRRERRLNRNRINVGNAGSLDSKFYTRDNGKEKDNINALSVRTEELTNRPLDIIPFSIQNIPATGISEFLYFRAYLDTMSDSYSGEWSGTRYIGRAEELYNYTGFKRGLQFSFKIAAHSKEELTPLYQKLNRLAGTTAPTYDKGLFMQGVFSKLTIGDYVQKLPGFFTSVDLTWQTAYPWEIGNVDSGGRDSNTPRVPHILDVSVSFQPVHDFAPQYGKEFIANISTA